MKRSVHRHFESGVKRAGYGGVVSAETDRAWDASLAAAKHELNETRPAIMSVATSKGLFTLIRSVILSLRSSVWRQ
jgi:hypothetical protein